jgi:hypothetical protein
VGSQNTGGLRTTPLHHGGSLERRQTPRSVQPGDALILSLAFGSRGEPEYFALDKGLRRAGDDFGARCSTDAKHPSDSDGVELG